LEERTIAEHVNDGFEVLVADLCILGVISGVDLDVVDQVDQELKRELESFLSNLDEEVALADDSPVVAGLIAVQEGLPEAIEVDVVNLV
jgi:hypothetical protein